MALENYDEKYKKKIITKLYINYQKAEILKYFKKDILNEVLDIKKFNGLVKGKLKNEKEPIMLDYYKKMEKLTNFFLEYNEAESENIKIEPQLLKVAEAMILEQEAQNHISKIINENHIQKTQFKKQNNKTLSYNPKENGWIDDKYYKYLASDVIKIIKDSRIQTNESVSSKQKCM